MSVLKQTGTLLDKEATQQISDKFSKRKFRLAIKETWPTGEKIESPEFFLVNDKCNLLDSVREGTEIEVSFSLTGADREYTKNGERKIFRSTELKAFAVDIVSAANIAPSTPAPAPRKGCTEPEYRAATRGEKMDFVGSDPSLLDSPFPPEDDNDLPF